MDKFKEKILQYIISGKAAKDNAIDMEISNDPSFDESDFQLLNKIWNEADNLKDYHRVNHADAWSGIAEQTGIDAKVKPIQRNRQWLLAASIIGLLGLGLYFYLTAEPYITYRALANEKYTLPDSSTVDMLEGTEIRYLKPGKFAQAPLREIFLTGQGVFDVVPAEKPFKVVTTLTSVDVLGTRFKYRVEGDFSESENLEGLVRFGTNDGSHVVTLNPGDKASFDGSTWAVDTFVPPAPPPAPIIIPTNNITIADLIDILGYLYPKRAELGATLKPRNTVIKLNLSDLNLDTLVSRLEKDTIIQFQAAKTSNGYRIAKLTAPRNRLKADYTFEMFIAGIKPNE